MDPTTINLRRYMNRFIPAISSILAVSFIFAEEKKAVALIRGLRFVSDIEFEFQLAWMNRNLNAEIITVFLMTDARYTHLNSSIIREVTILGGNVDDFVTPYVSQKLKEKLNK